MGSKRQLLSTSAVTAMVAFALMAGGHAHANPADGVVSAGSADISANGKTLDITQHSNKAVIDWRSFDIAPDETTNFHQPGSSAIILNRVHSDHASQIDGRLNANGNVVIINQNGIVFGAGANVDVNGLVASTSDVDNARFMNDAKVNFDLPGNTSASIINNGTITAHEAGLVGFVAPNVENNGVITATLGRVHLAGGDKATVDFYGDGLLEVEASDQLQQQIVKNTGTISADGGKVAMTAATGGQVVRSLINAQGVIKAQSVGVKNGEIVIGGGKNANSRVSVAGAIDASSVSGKGGKVTITADHIKLDATARIDASGATGGGDIKIGGDRHGVGATPTAQTLEVAQGSFIKNDALINGDGGETVLWSDGFTGFAGLISGRGGEDGGDGGFVEVSGKDVLDFDGFVDLTASEGYSFGNLLLDPTDITISSAADSGGSFGSGTYTPSGASSDISATTLQSQITSANVTISTTSAHGGNGDITFANPVTFTTTSRTLTLNADRDIVFNAAAGWTSGTGGFSMTAARDILFNANVSASGGGNINATAGRNLTVASGAVVKSGGTGGLSLRAAGGTISNTGVFTNSGTISAGTGTFTLLSGLDGSGNRGDLTLNSTNTLLQGANTAAITLTGFRDVTLSRNLTFNATSVITADRNLTVDTGVTLTASAGNLTLNAANAVNTGLGLLTLNGTLNQGAGNLTLLSGVDGSSNRNDLTLTTSNLTFTGATMGTLTLSGYRDVTFNRSINSNGSMAVTAIRNLTIGTGVTVAATGTSMSLAAAGGVITNTGVFNHNGVISMNTGTLSLISGVDTLGDRADISLTGTNLVTGATTSTTSMTGFRDVTIGRNFSTTGSLTINAERNLTINTGVALAATSSGNMNLKASNTAGITGLGYLSNSGTVSVNTGAITMASGVDGSGNRPDLLLNTSLYSTGAAAGSLSFTGFRDITVARNFTSTGSITIAAERDLTINTGVALTASAAGSMILRAAATSITNTGVLTLNGSLTLGTGSLTLQSGLDTLGNRVDVTLNSTNTTLLGANVGTTSVTGFRDVTLNRNLTSSASIAINAEGNLTIGTGINLVSGAAGGVALRASTTAGVNGNGALVNNGTVSVGTGTFVLQSGLDTLGNRTDLDLNNTTWVSQGASQTGIIVSGFRDITVNRSFTSAGSLSIAAERNLNIASGVVLTAGTTGNFTLRAAASSINNVGVLTNAGTWAVGSGTLVLSSGVDATGNRVDLTVDGTLVTLRSASVGATNISGFRDLTVSRAIPGSNSITLAADRDLKIMDVLNAGTGTTYSLTANRDIVFGANVGAAGGTSGIVAQAGRNLTVNSGVTLAPAISGALSLKAAGGVITNVGTLTINGVLNVSNGSLTLLTGLDGSGNRTTDLTLNTTNMTTQAASIGTVSLTGYRDIAINRSLISASTITATAERNLAVNSSLTAVGHLLRAAGGVSTNVGTLSFGTGVVLTQGTGALTLATGLDSGGVNSTDLTINSGSNIVFSGASVGIVNISGYRDYTINGDLTSSDSVTVTAGRDVCRPDRRRSGESRSSQADSRRPRARTASPHSAP